jgi:hypothetical protein
MQLKPQSSYFRRNTWLQVLAGLVSLKINDRLAF